MINIEIDPQQAYDRINEAIAMYTLQHFNGTTEVWDLYTVTDSDIANGYYSIPKDFVAVCDLLDPLRSSMGTGDEFDNLNYRVANSDFFDYTWSLSADMITSWVIFQEKLEMIKRYFAPERRFRHNPITGQMRLYGDNWLVNGYYVILHGYRAVDPAVNTNIFNDEWIKKYATALIGRQWGSNISKYDGVSLPGGVTMQGQRIYDRYDAQCVKYEEEFNNRYSLPAEFIVA